MKNKRWCFIVGSLIMIFVSLFVEPVLGVALRWVGSLILCVTLIGFFNSLAR